MITYRFIKNNEYHEMIKFMNKCFNLDFEQLLPKLYYPNNNDNLHYGAYDNEKLVGVVGLYPNIYINNTNNKQINVCGIGGVCVDEKYRNQGIMSQMMKDVVNYCQDKYVFLYLGGNRLRYKHFGFDYLGENFEYSISKNTLKYLKDVKEYQVIEINKDSNLNDLLELYNKYPLHMNRTIDNFYDTIHSWHANLYQVFSNNSLIGYYIVIKNFVLEYSYIEGYTETILHAMLSNIGSFTTVSQIDDKRLIPYSNELQRNNNSLINVLNKDALCDFLDICCEKNKSNEELFGNVLYPKENSIFILREDDV